MEKKFSVLLLLLALALNCQTNRAKNELKELVCSQREDTTSWNCTNSTNILEFHDFHEVLELEANIILEFSGSKYNISNTSLIRRSELTFIGGPSVLYCCSNDEIYFDISVLHMHSITVENCSFHTNYLSRVELSSTYIISSLIVISRTDNISIKKSKFLNSTLEIIFRLLKKPRNASVIVSETSFFEKTSGKAAFSMEIGSMINMFLHIMDCNFHNNSRHFNILTTTTPVRDKERRILITNSNFVASTSVGITIKADDIDHRIELEFLNTNFSNHSGYVLNLENVNVTISGCQFQSNRAGLKTQCDGSLEILHTTFSNTSEALYSSVHTKITDCRFLENNVMCNTDLLQALIILHSNATVSSSLFEKNYGCHFNCTILYARNVRSLLIENSSIVDNNCTGILLNGSVLTVNQSVTISRNTGILGGGLSLHGQTKYRCYHTNLEESKLNLLEHSRLKFESNKAQIYGGGIYIDKQICNDNVTCFFSTNDYHYDHLTFSGNSADVAGDAIFGGCLSHCHLNSKIIDLTDNNNTFWRIVKQTNSSKSASLFAESPKRVVFCKNETTSDKLFLSKCFSNDTVSTYPGKQFTISLMVADESCFASRGIIQAKIVDKEK